jgi:hypothetical protein
MLSKSGLTSLSYLIAIVCGLGIVPFKWDLSNHHMESDGKGWKFYTWASLIFMEMAHSAFLTGSLAYSLWVVKAPITLLAAQSLWNALFLIALLLHYTTYQHVDQIPSFFNRWLKMEESCKGKEQQM